MTPSQVEAGYDHNKMRSDGIITLTRLSLLRGDTALSQRCICTFLDQNVHLIL